MGGDWLGYQLHSCWPGDWPWACIERGFRATDWTSDVHKRLCQTLFCHSSAAQGLGRKSAEC